jgi:hypothetical protein
MPTLVGHYLTAWLYDRTSASCIAFAEALPSMSPDRLTRLLRADWSGHRLLELTWRPLFVWQRGYLIIDDTVLAKAIATAIERLAWVYASRDHPPVSGLSLVLWVWTNGTVRLSRGMRLWHKGGPQSMTWRSSGSAMPAPVGAAIPNMCSLMPGIPPNACSIGFGTMGGTACAA